MQTEELTGLLHACPLFADISPVTVGGLLAGAGASAALFPAGEAIPAADPSGRPQLVVLTKGKAAVTTPDPGHAVLLRFLRAGDLFGIANLFSDEASVSTVRAETDCSCLLLTENAVRYLLDTDAEFRENYIGFLSGRVRFLNKKIGYLTAGSAERRLALYLAGLGAGDVTLTESVTSLSDLLNLGRASLYRAFDRLTADGWLIRNGKRLRLTDPDAMLAFYRQ